MKNLVMIVHHLNVETRSKWWSLYFAWMLVSIQFGQLITNHDHWSLLSINIFYDIESKRFYIWKYVIIYESTFYFIISRMLTLLGLFLDLILLTTKTNLLLRLAISFSPLNPSPKFLSQTSLPSWHFNHFEKSTSYLEIFIEISSNN